MQDPSSTHDFSKEQKTGFVLLLIFGVLTVALGFLQIRNTIYKPFIISSSQTEDGSDVTALLDETTRLQTIDTDQDGLNDYQELHFFQTSPYIPDTDSDGLTDKQELDGGTDPLCPRGEDCSKSQLPTEQEKAPIGISDLANVPTAQDLVNSAAPQLPNAPANTANANSEGIAQLKELLKDPAKLRASLVQSGQVSESDLAQFDDATLVKTFEDILAKQQAAVPAGATPQP